MDSRERRARTLLKDLGVAQPFLIRWGPVLWLAVLFVVASVLHVNDQLALSRLRLGNLATPLVTVGAVFLALHQYRQQRNESTIAGALGRLDLVNSYYRSADAARILGPLFGGAEGPAWAKGLAADATWQQRMYIFLELDNLQYGLERFRLGHSTAYQALRTVDLFGARCHSAVFLAIAQELVAEKAGSYTRETRSVVCQMAVGYRPLTIVEA
jgi:hypothetical protein